MTLLELKQQIVNIENQLASIDIPIRVIGKKEVNIRFILAFEQSGNIVADMQVFGVPEIDNAQLPVRRRIANLDVGEEIAFSLDENKASTIYNAASIIGREYSRVYKTRSNWDERVIRVIREK